MAIKEVRLDVGDDFRQRAEDSCKQLEEEILLMRELKHPNIVRYFGAERQKNTLYIFMEFASEGSVSKLISKWGPFRETMIRRYTRQILLGLDYLHHNSIIHRDIKGDNILVHNDGTVKLADFNCSKRIKDMASGSNKFKSDTNKSLLGTPHFMAPEVMKQSGHGRKADIWSVGCTVIQMATGNPPFSNFSNAAQLILSVAMGTPPSIPTNLSEAGQDFLRQCLHFDPQDRPTTAELLEHLFVNEESFEGDVVHSELDNTEAHKYYGRANGDDDDYFTVKKFENQPPPPQQQQHQQFDTYNSTSKQDSDYQSTMDGSVIEHPSIKEEDSIQNEESIMGETMDKTTTTTTEATTMNSQAVREDGLVVVSPKLQQQPNNIFKTPRVIDDVAVEGR